MAIGILLLIQFVVFFVTHFIVSNESTKCNHETATYTNKELKELIKEIEKEYPKFYKEIIKSPLMNVEDSNKRMELFVNNCIVDSKKDRIKYELIKKKTHMVNHFTHNPTDLICANKIIVSTRNMKSIKKYFDSKCTIDYYGFFDENLNIKTNAFFDSIDDKYGPIIGLSDRYAVIKDEDCNYYLIDFFKEEK